MSIFNSNNFITNDYNLKVSPNFQNSITYYRNKDLATTSSFNYNQNTNTLTVNNVSTQRVLGLQLPINSDDATNKGYVDSKTFDLTSLSNNSILATNTSSSIITLNNSTFPSLIELSYLKNVTSSIQSQINNKENTITSGTNTQYYRGDKTFQTLNQAAIDGLKTTSNVTFNNLILNGLTGERALYIDNDKNIRHSLVSTTELNHLFGVSSNIQNQLNNLSGEKSNLTLNNTSNSNLTLILSRVNTANNDILFRASSIDKYIVGYDHIYDSLSLFDVVNNKQLIEANNNRVYIRDKTIISNNRADVITPNAILELKSTTQAFLLPRLTQSQKFAIANPVAGMEVYDNTSNVKSYYNGTNWYVPSWLSLNLDTSDADSSIILWDNVDNSPDTRIIYNAFNGTITFVDVGVYLINATGNFRGSETLEEYRCEIQFRQGSTIIARGLDQTLKQQSLSGTQNVFGSASITYLLNVSNTGTYNFFFDSENNSNITFDASSHAYIHRIS